MKKLLILLISVFCISSCSDITSFDDDINQNPNLPHEASSPQLLASAMLSLPGLTSRPVSEYMAQYLSQTIYVSESLYPEGGTSFYGWYQGPLINLKIAQDNATTANQAAVAKILKVYYFWNITDRWGDVPYSAALKGIDNFTPTYDAQKVIYDSLFTTLKEAGNQIETSGTLGSDIMYNGDMGKWKKLSSTIRLLMALRLSEVDPDRGKQEFNDALNDGIMSSNDDSFTFKHLATTNNQNYWYGQIVQPPIREWWALSKGLVELMQPVNDPRLAIYGDTTGVVESSEADAYNGLKFGTTGSIDTQNYSLLGDAVHAQDSPVYLVTYAEALFAKAEAAKLGWITEDPETNYNRAVKKSMLQWTGSTDGADDFLKQPDIAYSSSDGIERIATQRYVHLFLNGYEAWAEWRRTGYPDIMVKPNGRDVPLRRAYTADEKLNNTENYNEAVDRQFGGDNSIYGRLWWDVE